MKLYILLLLLVFFNYSESFFYILPLFNKIFNKKYDLDKICSNIVGPKKYNTTLKNIDYNIIERSNRTYF